MEKKTYQDLRKEVAQSMGISVEVLPPYTGRDIAIYCATEQGGIDPLVREAQWANVLPPAAILEGTYSFYDPHNPNPYKANVLMKNVTRMNAVPQVDASGKPTGASTMQEDIESVVFEGSLVVNIRENFPLYVFLELHPKNRTGKYRSKSGPYVFYRADLSIKGRGVRNIESDLAAEAIADVQKLDKKKIFEYALQTQGEISVNDNSLPSDVKRDLQDWAYRNPTRYFNMISNRGATTKITIAKAIDYGFLVLNKDTKNWDLEGQLWRENAKTDNNPVESLYKYLMTPEGANDLLLLEKVVNYWD